MLLHPPQKRRGADVAQVVAGEGVDPAALLRKSGGLVSTMQCNFHRLPLIVFTSN
jgi:hypothetical protein